MQTQPSVRVWMVRGLPVLLLALGLAAAPVAQADDSITSMVTVFAPGAPLGASVSIQYQNGASWQTVGGSTATLSKITTLGVPFQSWTVDPSLYGQGLFRWLINNLDGATVWGVSEAFFMPVKGGLNLTETIGQVADVGRMPTSVLAVLTLPVPAVQAPVLQATTSTQSTFCHQGDCASAEISTYITGFPTSSWIGVEWQNPQGYWQPVPNWEAPAYLQDPPALLMYQQWSVLPVIYGHGPFRWAVYGSANGGILGASPSFNLPTSDKQNFIMYLSN